MRFLLDENVSYRVAGHLKAAGHEAPHVSEIGLTSTEDAVIFARARDEGCVLLTADHDFVQMLFASGDTSPSLILVGYNGDGSNVSTATASEGFANSFRNAWFRTQFTTALYRGMCYGPQASRFRTKNSAASAPPRSRTTST